MAFYDLKLSINSPVSTADVCAPIFQRTQEKLAIKKVPVFCYKCDSVTTEDAYPHGYNQHREWSNGPVSTAIVFQIMLFKYRLIIEHLQHLM